MAWKPKKKKKTLSYADQLAVKKLIEDAKAKRKTLRGYAILKRDGAKQDLKMSGMFKDADELDECAKKLAEELSKVSGKHWEVVEVEVLNNAVYEDDEKE